MRVIVFIHRLLCNIHTYTSTHKRMYPHITHTHTRTHTHTHTHTHTFTPFCPYMIQAITEMKKKMHNLSGSLKEIEELMQIATMVHSEGRREGRKEALDEVEQLRLACHQMSEEVGQFLQDTQDRCEQLQHTLASLVPMICSDTTMRSGRHRGLNESLVFGQQPVSVSRQSSEDSTTLGSKREANWRRQQRTTSSSAEPVSPTSSCSGETRFDTADERREEPQPYTTPLLGQGKYLSSSDEERKNKANGLELHPRKMLASRKKKGKM